MERDWNFIKDTIDMDEWRHSWHLPDDYDKRVEACREVLTSKLAQRLDDIEKIRKALVMLEAN